MTNADIEPWPLIVAAVCLLILATGYSTSVPRRAYNPRNWPRLRWIKSGQRVGWPHEVRSSPPTPTKPKAIIIEAEKQGSYRYQPTYRYMGLGLVIYVFKDMENGQLFEMPASAVTANLGLPNKPTNLYHFIRTGDSYVQLETGEQPKLPL